jgi:superoxide reductase
MSDAPVLGGIHRMEDINTADDFTKKHTPYIEAVRDGNTVTVTVEVGHYVGHPNTADHFIEYIDLVVDHAPVARFSFTAIATSPKVTATLNLDPETVLVARESCNLHGIWEAEITV